MGLDRWTRPSRLATNNRRWPALRLAAKRRDDYRCVKCGARGRLEVDHIEPVRLRPDLAFSLENLQSLCPSCHARKTNEEMGRKPNPARVAWRAAVAELVTRQRKT